MNEDKSWITWFLTKHPIGKYFIRVEMEYIKDQFNLFGFPKKVPNYKKVLEYIKGDYIPPENRIRYDLDENIDDLGIRLYGLIHSRFIMEKAGLEKLKKKYENNDYDRCPNVNCNRQCLPIGLSESLGEGCLYMYCPFCGDVYHAENQICSQIDGSAFGSSYIMKFLKQYPEVQQSYEPDRLPPKPQLRLFGFKIEDPKPSDPKWNK
ncbi:Casein kinase II regulatory subunit family protein [Trichomonas vaginalis G3]|uniref:Casein kinase II subunit beta n=1 Tax=Trichomonas vaginalis (strain ATCC PRA-98 / G3) TaxID=412133 RepID=A2FUM6_TRIV3|nr:protein kinase regulator protein [Trichomonas vaginalis G3]EAX91374.1 Casein kinase II regulatory subunit family protein [Trichomonas vaginalis G3]KAI5483599.1 protein kinase regulator protein [Trichomonas vaginalis G3]|eukprot:XP_001304304.1 Casein kinase II regulatory subunit family protein [Trichomonas vaginalis G3]